MKKILCSILILASMAALVCACGELDGDEDEPGSIYGYWKLDKLTIEASASVIGNGSLNTSVIDFTNNPCYLHLAEDMMASGRMGLDVELSGYSYDSNKNAIHFNRSISVSNDGKAMVLVGSYEITELTLNTLVLRQPDFNIDVPGLFSSHQTAIYAFHRVPNDN